MAAPKKSVLFVCLGNICRSPMAEAVFLDILGKRNQRNEWEVDSAAVIDYHLGKNPERRTLETLKKNGIQNYQHKVRQVTSGDFDRFDYIFGMDDDNIGDLENLLKERKSAERAKGKAQLGLLGEFDPKGVRIIPDPYYNSGTQMFDQVYVQCVRACTGFLDSLQK